MKLKEHQFFKAIELASEIQKRAITLHGANSDLAAKWGVGRNNGKSRFLLALKAAHPFSLDQKTTNEKVMAGRTMMKFKDLVKEFSLPFKTTLYLLKNSTSIAGPLEGYDQQISSTPCGYLIQEQDPEHFTAWQVSMMEIEGKTVPYFYEFQIDLKTIGLAIAHSESLEFDIFNKTTEAHIFKEICTIFHITNCISVKRIGIERKPSLISIKNKSATTGFTVLKFDNIIHIADKVDYEYTAPNPDDEINWEYAGFRRGHWRAFYLKDSNGKTAQDFKGWNKVDYGRNGKNRQGEYNVPGYTWVIDTVLGDPEIAEVKLRTVKHK